MNLYHLRNKIINIALAKVNVYINNSLIKAKSIILIDAQNLNILDLFNNPDGKINHLIGDGMLKLDLLSRKMRIFVCLIVQ